MKVEDNWLIGRHRNMQKLDWRDTCTPLDSKVRSNCDSLLNSLERNRGHDLKTGSNSSDENQRSDESGMDLRGPIINMQKSTNSLSGYDEHGEANTFTLLKKSIQILSALKCGVSFEGSL